MLACCAKEEEEGRERERERAEIQTCLFALAHPSVQGVREWFLGLGPEMNANEVFEAARGKRLGERYAVALKTLYQHRGTDAFRELAGE